MGIFSFLYRRKKTEKAPAYFSAAVKRLLLNETLDEGTYEKLEQVLLAADIGVTLTSELLQHLQNQRVKNGKEALQILQQQLESILRLTQKPLLLSGNHKLTVMLVVGVNGVGKTTAVAKLAYQWIQSGQSVLLAAGDTFRAAATEQLAAWCNQYDIPLTKGASKTSALVYDAMHAAKSQKKDILLIDTAGRLHNQDHLMRELNKVQRVIQQIDATAPHHILMVIDGMTGQNALRQVELFKQSVNITGLIITKLDGSGKGGMVFALAKQFGLPIYFYGVGEGIEDLKVLEVKQYVQHILGSDE